MQKLYFTMYKADGKLLNIELDITKISFWKECLEKNSNKIKAIYSMSIPIIKKLQTKLNKTWRYYRLITVDNVIILGIIVRIRSLFMCLLVIILGITLIMFLAIIDEILS